LLFEFKEISYSHQDDFRVQKTENKYLTRLLAKQKVSSHSLNVNSKYNSIRSPIYLWKGLTIGFIIRELSNSFSHEQQKLFVRR